MEISSVRSWRNRSDSSGDLLSDFKNTALQEDEEEENVETLTLDQEDIDDAVDTYDEVETLELEN